VKDRLTKEISYWDHRAETLKLQEQAGKPNARLNSQEARRRADELQSRLQKRMEQLDLESKILGLATRRFGRACGGSHWIDCTHDRERCR
jgi:ABC-type phosphate transport system auxiliary subunit